MEAWYVRELSKTDYHLDGLLGWLAAYSPAMARAAKALASPTDY
jgi:hypothetical protein